MIGLNGGPTVRYGPGELLIPQLGQSRSATLTGLVNASI